MIKARNLSFSFPDSSVFKNISFDIDDGDFVAVLGPNGAGKTTIAKLITGLLPMQKGTLEVLGTPITELSDKSNIGYVPQKFSIDSLFPGTLQEILKTQDMSRSRILEQLGLTGLLSKKFVELSGGQQQRVLLAIALEREPKLLILDEPTVGVDTKTQHDFLKLLKQINQKKNITIMLITHDIGMVPEIATKVMCISHNICCTGAPAETKKLLMQVYDSSYKEHHHHHD